MGIRFAANLFDHRGGYADHPKILEAAKRVGKRRSDSEINAITDEFENRLISFEYSSIVIYTSG